MKISDAIKLRGDKPKQKTEVDKITEVVTPILMNHAGWIIPMIIYLSVSGFVLNILFWKEHILFLLKFIYGGLIGFILVNLYQRNKQNPYFKKK